MAKPPRRISSAHVIAMIALFVALGGVAWGATSLPKNSVGTKQLKKNAVTGAKIKNGAVTAAKINPSGLTVQNANHATSADSATNATTAAALQGFAANQLVRATTASVGTTGDPCDGSIGTGFNNFSSTTFTTAISKNVTAPSAGVLLVFSYLIVPAVCAVTLARRISVRLLLGWLISLAGGIAGQFGNFQGVGGSFNGGAFQGGFNGSLGALGASQAVSLISVISKVVARVPDAQVAAGAPNVTRLRSPTNRLSTGRR